jgi:arsenate reductase
MLEAILRHRLGERIEVASAGTDPAPEVHPLALRALAEAGIRHEAATPKTVADLPDPAFDLAVTVCDRARESCPVLPGAVRKLHVGYPDPAAATGAEEERLGAFREVRDSMLAWTDLLASLLELAGGIPGLP